MSKRFVFKIARPGYDVHTADNDDLVFSSDFSSFKIIKIIKFTGADTTAHGLGYAPAFLAMHEDGSGNYELGNPGYFDGMLTKVYVDATNVYCLWAANDTYVFLFTDRLDE